MKVLLVQNRLGIFFFKAEQTEIKSLPISSNLSGLRREVGAEILIAAIGAPLEFKIGAAIHLYPSASSPLSMAYPIALLDLIVEINFFCD